MRNRYDQLAKQMLALFLNLAGEVTTGLEVSPEVQLVDTWFVPGPHRTQSLGLLGQLLEHTALFEPFHEPPSADELRACLHKQLALHLSLNREANSPVSLPWLWILSAGRPATVIGTFGFVHPPGTTQGMYLLPPGFRIGLVVLSELERTRDTLLMRLMGARNTLEQALSDLLALPEDAPELQIILPILIRLRFIIELEVSERTEEEVLIMNGQQAFEAFQQQTLQKGIEKGMKPLLRLFERSLRRPLAEGEKAELGRRLDTLGPDRLGDVVLDLPPEELAAWLADPHAQ